MTKYLSITMILILAIVAAWGCQVPVNVPESPAPPSKPQSSDAVPPVAKPTASTAYIEKINTIPDYTQTDQDYGGFPGKGAQHCGPASASNALVWFADNGFPNLVPHSGVKKKDQFDVIYLLGSEKYMNTGITGTATGTNPTKFCRGLRDYINDKGYKYSRFEFQGWRDIPAEFDTRISVPDLEWIKKGVKGLNAVFLSIGWYAYDPSSDEYNRFNSHWVTMVGYGHDGKVDNPDTLIIHNPGTRSSDDTSNEYLFPDKINSGKLTGGYTGLPRSAVGYHKVKIIGTPKNADAAILEYAIVLEMQP